MGERGGMDVKRRGAQARSRRGRGAGSASRARVSGLGPGSEAASSELFPLFAGQRPSPPAANPKEVTAGAAKGGPGRLGGEGPDSAGHF